MRSASEREPAALPIKGGEHLITNSEFLERDRLPRRIVFVGGGFIYAVGFERTVFAELGVEGDRAGLLLLATVEIPVVRFFILERFCGNR